MIQLKNAYKVYQTNTIQTPVLSDVSFEVDKGEFIMITGRSGCGKTTLLNILAGIDLLTSGEYFFEGREISGLKGKKLATFRNKDIGYVFQSYYLMRELNACQNVEMPLGYAGYCLRERKAKAEEMLNIVGMADKMKNYPSQLSGGQQQRVAVARAIINEPRLLLADEPTGNLDQENVVIVMELLRAINKKGATIIMATHDRELMRYADRIIKL